MTVKTKTLSDYVEVKGRFRRSIHLEKDYVTASQNGDYIVTPTAREALRRLTEGMGKSSPFRAWTLTGPYGVGKSAFAVFLTRLLCAAGKHGLQAKTQLEQADPLLIGHLRELGLFGRDSKGFLPVLATARRTSASRCLAEGIVASASATNIRSIKASVRHLREELSAHRNGQPWDTRQVVEGISSLSKAATEAGYQGVLLIVDELGKLFEYSARYPQKSDVFVLQELAEQAARSSSSPIVLVGLLHQSFEEYGLHLDLATRREWAKIQGRFEDIAFLEPAEQVIRMISQAIQWHGREKSGSRPDSASEIAAVAAIAGIAPPAMQSSEFEATASAAYPLHPVTLVALPFVFRRFAQNERSLFSYLSSMEPYGFQEFIKTHELTGDNPPVVRLSDLFDYFTRSFGAGLYRHPHALRWREAADILECKDDLSPLQRDVVKTVGVLNALGEFCHLNATEDVVSLAISDTPKPNSDLRVALKSLKDASIVTFRKFNKTYRIWEGSDVDIEERITEGERKIRQGLNLADSVKRYLPSRPLVARRHSFETGALRYFAVEYIDNPQTLCSHLDTSDPDADGIVLVCLAESPLVGEEFRALAREEQERLNVLFAIPQLIGELRAVVTELGALKWAWDNTPELRDDRVARREMSLRITEVDQMLQRNLDGLLDPRDEPVGSGCLWVYNGEDASVRSPVDVSQLLSNICDAIYEKAPRIRNELITRRSLSSAAAAARRNLIDRMLNHHGEETLGIEGYPPERSMYESVLKATGLHRQDHDGTWRFLAPGNRNATKIVSAWNCVRDALFERQPEPIPLTVLFANLASPPYGVMPGLHPVLLCAFMIAHPDETTLYREGTFLPEPGIADFEVLMRRPELFAIAGSRVTGGREAVVDRLATGLKVTPSTVPVVRALFRMVKGLPDFAWNTRRLPDATLAMRDAFQNAKSPEQFLFVALPNALNLPAFSEAKHTQAETEVFFRALNKSLKILSGATASAIDTARDILLESCGFERGAEHWPSMRAAAVALEPAVTDPRLLTFLKRVTQNGADGAGIESVLALVANRPPRNWSDTDVDRFPEAAAAMGKAFQTAASSTGISSNADSQFAALPRRERRQAQHVFDRVKTYLHRNANGATPRAIRAAVTRLLEEIDND
jgi:hypothetical protein